MAGGLGLWMLLAGCGEYTQARCARWDELDITDPAGEAPADMPAEVRAAIDQFAAWSPRDGLCVEEGRLVEEIDDERDPVGIYYGYRIEIEYRAVDPTWVTFHELCHAADDEAGRLSEAHSEWFGTEDPAEAFAGLCEPGPRAVSALEGVEAACGVDLGSGRQRLINEEVYGAAAVDDEPPAGTLPIALERRAVGELSDTDLWTPSPGGSAVYFLRDVEDDGVRSVGFARLDPETAAFELIDGPAVANGRDIVVFGSDAGPVIALEGEARAWRADEDGGVLVEVPFVAFEQHYAGAVLDGIAWVFGVVEGEADATFSRIDLAAGAREVRALPDGVRSWYPAPDGAMLAGRAGYVSGSGWLAYDPATDAWTAPHTPAGWASSQRVTLPDARVLATWMDLVGVEPGFVSVLDPESGAWWLADAPCGEDAVGRPHDLLSVGGVPYLWERGEELALTRIVVEGE